MHYCDKLALVLSDPIKNKLAKFITNNTNFDCQLLLMIQPLIPAKTLNQLMDKADKANLFEQLIIIFLRFPHQQQTIFKAIKGTYRQLLATVRINLITL